MTLFKMTRPGHKKNFRRALCIHIGRSSKFLSVHLLVTRGLPRAPPGVMFGRHPASAGGTSISGSATLAHLKVTNNMSGYLSHSELHGDQPQLAIPSSHTSATPPSQPHDPQSKPKKEPYSIFTRPEKWFIVALVSYGSLFSPLTTSIYLVAIPTLSSTFHTSIEHINLSVTVYMIAQAISRSLIRLSFVRILTLSSVAPMVWGPLADRYGRRLPFVACMITLSLASMGLALIPTSAYWLLLVLRFLQSAGSASTVALGKLLFCLFALMFTPLI